jgi:tetratricopeptide (TPR) repeat protein
LEAVAKMANIADGWEKVQRAWELLQAEKEKTALKLLKEAAKMDPTLPTLSGAGTAFLWAGAYHDAKALFDEMVNSSPEVEAGYEWSGVASWLLADPTEAVRVWKNGLSARYRDAAGGVDIPLLLYFASVRRPDVANVAEIKHLLAERLKSSWARNWPAPLGKFVLGKITEAKLRQEALDPDDDFAQREQTARVSFYVGVVALERGDKNAYEEGLRTCKDVPDNEDVCEFHLARWETERNKRS